MSPPGTTAMPSSLGPSPRREPADDHALLLPAGQLNRCLYLLKSDPAFRARYLEDQEATMEELALDAPARAALRDFERDRLIALGAHSYLVFMADLRLNMDRKPAEFEHF